MELNEIYERIIEANGECFKDAMPNCQDCPFIDKCLTKIINEAKPITAEQRVGWALDKLVEEIMFDEEE